MKALISMMLCGVAIIAVGCGVGVAGSCQASSGSANFCVEYHGTYSPDTAKTACTAAKGTFTATACVAGATKGVYE
jgi:hypothetical protein